ncbi:hypothetical protein MMC13_005743 [Lambiella insularis]|nr:hypothetical protein [Lambiella insularis]
MASQVSRASRSRRTPIRKKPSAASLFSNLTHASNGSNDSNATVTPESVAKSKQRASKSGTSRMTTSTRASNRKHSSRSTPTMPPVEERPNVFEFMVEDEDGHGEAVELEGIHVPQELHLDTASVGSSSSAEQSYYTRATRIQKGQRQGWDEHSLPSGSSFNDSGISVRSSSPERDSPILRQKLPNSRVSKGKSKQINEDAPVDSTTHYVTSPRVLRPFDGGPDTSPEAFYSTASRPSLQHHGYTSSECSLPSRRNTDHDVEVHDQEASGMPDDIKPGDKVTTSKMSLDKGASAPVKPVYRKFESLNNRALLCLQDDISDLETRLHHIDQAIAAAGNDGKRKEMSANGEIDESRHLRWQRRELIGQILTNLDQYNRALSSYSDVTKQVNDAAPTDIEAYKAWMSEHSSTNDTQNILDYHKDLITIDSRHRRQSTNSERPAIATGFAILMTIIAFKITPQFLSRLVVGMIIGVAMSCSGLPSTNADLNHLQESGKRIAIYAAVMIILALAVG